MKKFLSILLTVLIVVTVGTVNVMAEGGPTYEVHNYWKEDDPSSANDSIDLWVAEGEDVSVKVFTHQEGDNYYYRLESTSNGDVEFPNSSTPNNDFVSVDKEYVVATNDGTNSLTFTGKKVGTTKFIYRERSGGKDDSWSTNAGAFYFEFNVHVYSKPTLATDLTYKIGGQSLLQDKGKAPEGYKFKYQVVEIGGTLDENKWTADDAKAQDAGSYYVYWRIEDSESNIVVYDNTPLGPVDIAKAKISASQNYETVILTSNENEISGYEDAFDFNGYAHEIKNFATITNEAGEDTETYSIRGLDINNIEIENTKISDYITLSGDNKKIVVSETAAPGTYIISLRVRIGDNNNNYTVTGTDTRNYVNFKYTFTINKAKLSDITVIFNGDDGAETGLTLKNRYKYKDIVINPQLTLKIGNYTLIPGVDYTIGGDYQDKKIVGRYYLHIVPVGTSEYIGTEEDISNYNNGDYETRFWYIFDSDDLASYVSINGTDLKLEKSGNYYVDTVNLTYNTFEQIVKVAVDDDLITADAKPTILYSTDGGKTYTSTTPFSITNVILNEDKSVGSTTFYYQVSRSGFTAIHGKVTVTMNKAVAYALPVYKEIDICDFKLADYQIDSNSKLTYKLFVIENKGDTTKENWIEIENHSDVSTSIGSLYAAARMDRSDNQAISSTDVYPGPYYAGIRSKAAANVGITSNYEKILSYGCEEVDDYKQQAVKTDKDGKVIYNTTKTSKIPVLTEKLGAFVITADLSKATVFTDHETYDGTMWTPVPEVSFETADNTPIKVIINSSDYKLSYHSFYGMPYWGSSWYVNAGTYYYIINGIKDAKYITNKKEWNSFVIDPRPIEVKWTNKNSNTDIKDQMHYNGLHQQDDPTITNLVNNVLNSNKKDTCEVEFAYAKDTGSGKGDSLENTINAGKYYVTIAGVKNPNYTIVGGINLDKQYEILPMLIQVALKYNDNANFLTKEVKVADMVKAILINGKVADTSGSNLTNAEREIWVEGGLNYAFYKYPYSSTPTTDFNEKGMYSLYVVIPKTKFDTKNYQIQIAETGSTNEESYVKYEFYVVDAYNNNEGTYGNGKELYGMIIKNKTEDGFDNASVRYTDYEYFENLLERVEKTNPTDPNFDMGEPKFVLTLNAKKVTSEKAKAKILEIANGKKYSAIEVTPTMQYMVNGVITPMSSLASEKYFLNANTSLELTFPVDKKIDGNRRTYTLYHLVWDKDNEKYVVDGNVTKSWTVKDASSGKVTVTTSSTTSPFFIVWNDWTKESSTTTKTVAKAVVNTSLD